MADFERPLVVKVLGRFVLTLGLVYILSTRLDQYFSLNGGIQSYIIVASLITLLNLFARPILHLIFAPFHFLFGFIATIVLNLVFLYFTMKIAVHFDPSIVIFQIKGGTAGFVFIAIIVGIANWLMKEVGGL